MTTMTSAATGSVATAASASTQMANVNKKFRKIGITMGLISGFTYGVFTVLAMIAGGYEPMASASLAGFAGILVVPYITTGLNDLIAGIWLTIYNAKAGRLPELGRSLSIFPGKIIVLGSLMGGPIANGAYLVGVYLAGAYAIPISALTALFGAVFGRIFLKQKITPRVMGGMVICVAGAIIINLTKPVGVENFTLGIIFAIIAAVAWALEGVASAYGGAMLESEVAVNLRQLISGIVCLFVILPLIGGMGLLKETVAAGTPVIWLALAGLGAAVSFLTWYKANATVGVAIGMSLNVTYAFWGVIFSIIFLGQATTVNMMLGSVIIIIGAILVTMNPLDMFKKGE